MGEGVGRSVRLIASLQDVRKCRLIRRVMLRGGSVGTYGDTTNRGMIPAAMSEDGMSDKGVASMLTGTS